MNITKDQISDVANKMVLPLEEAKQSALDMVKSALYNIALGQIPSDVIDFSVKYPSTKSSFSTYLYDSDTNREYFSVLVPFGNAFASYSNATAKEKANILPKVDAYKAAKSLHYSTRKRISCMLSNLRTHKKIAEEFPEAYTILCELLKLPENKSNRCDDVEKLRADLSVLTKSN